MRAELAQKHPLAQSKEERLICVLLGVAPQGGWSVHSIRHLWRAYSFMFCTSSIKQVLVGQGAWGVARYIPASRPLLLLFPQPGPLSTDIHFTPFLMPLRYLVECHLLHDAFLAIFLKLQGPPPPLTRTHKEVPILISQTCP